MKVVSGVYEGLGFVEISVSRLVASGYRISAPLPGTSSPKYPECSLYRGSTWRPRGLSKLVISRVIIGGNSSWGAYNSTYNLLTKSPGPPSSWGLHVSFRVSTGLLV